jgi:hypothetical protein
MLMLRWTLSIVWGIFHLHDVLGVMPVLEALHILNESVNIYFIRLLHFALWGARDWYLGSIFGITLKLLFLWYKNQLFYINILIINVLLLPLLIIGHLHLFVLHFHAFLPFFTHLPLYLVIHIIFYHCSLVLHPSLLLVPISASVFLIL